MSRPLVIYGVPFSQPVRAVLWLFLYKKKAFELRLINPGSPSEGGSRHPGYLAKFPLGTIPGLEDRETGFVLSESHAIMIGLVGMIYIPPQSKRGPKLIHICICIIVI